MKRVAGIPFGVLVAVATAGVVGVTYLAGGGAIFSPGELNSSLRSEQPRGGVHSHGELSKNCSACHTGLFSDEPMSTRCLACHTEVATEVRTGDSLHGKFSNASNCSACHTEHKGASASITDMASFDHKLTRFPLTGAHSPLECTRCHQNQEFRGTPQSCSACHAEPKVHLGQFGLDCAKCHTTSTWEGAKFDHSTTRFSLTGGHTRLDCAQCHKDGQFRNTPMSCSACHAEPKVHLGQFGLDCAKCHTTSTWKDATFDHGTTRFPLTGAHTRLDCAQCHKDGQFRNTPTSCSACHAEPKVHLGQFGLDCAKCHTTKTWDGAKFDHEFPLTHGGHRNNPISCVTCHTTPGDYKAYTCYECHEHEKSRMERKHREQRVKNLDDCAACHSNGREHGGRRGERRGGEDDDAMLSPGQAPSAGVQELIAAMTGSTPAGMPQGGCPATGSSGCTR